MGFRTRHEHAWLSNFVRRIINNPAYAGYTAYDETAYEQKVPSEKPRHQQTLFKGEHPAIITPECWKKAQIIKVDENSYKRTRGSNPKHIFSLTGIIRCPKCMAPMPRERYLNWSTLLRRVYGEDVLVCPYCKATRRIIAFIEDHAVARRILEHLGLPSTGPPIAPARPRPQMEMFLS